MAAAIIASSPYAALAFSYSGSVSGDLGTFLGGGVFSFTAGANTVAGTFNNNGPLGTQDNDSFGFSIPAGLQLQSVSFAFAIHGDATNGHTDSSSAPVTPSATSSTSCPLATSFSTPLRPLQFPSSAVRYRSVQGPTGFSNQVSVATSLSPTQSTIRGHSMSIRLHHLTFRSRRVLPYSV